VPLIGSTGKKKKVKAGGDLTIGAPPPVLLAGSKARQYGVATQEIVSGKATMTIAPNPLATGFATVQFSLPRAGEARVRVTDVTGRTVVSRTLAATRTGAVGLDLRSLAAGVYLVRLDAEGYSTQQKLVVQH
ncbi:T9SS type A sorting domain-containing protein, partial [candidate division WOR-3 bacterium]|nr:T9SS type A sorting domain-containing protein [candidate division WOR-3 bacterium]